MYEDNVEKRKRAYQKKTKRKSLDLNFSQSP